MTGVEIANLRRCAKQNSICGSSSWDDQLLGTVNARPHSAHEGNHRRKVYRLKTRNDVTPTRHPRGVLPALRKQPAENYLSRYFAQKEPGAEERGHQYARSGRPVCHQRIPRVRPVTHAARKKSTVRVGCGRPAGDISVLRTTGNQIDTWRRSNADSSA